MAAFPVYPFLVLSSSLFTCLMTFTLFILHVLPSISLLVGILFHFLGFTCVRRLQVQAWLHGTGSVDVSAVLFSTVINLGYHLFLHYIFT